MSQYTKTTNFASKDNLSPGNPLKIVKGTEIDTEFNNLQTAIATKTDNASAAITGGSITGITDLAIADGGTGASTATAALNNLLPSQTGNATKYLQTDGTNATWDAVSLSTSDITGTLPVANGGTGVTTSTGTGSVVLSNSPTLVTPALGTPSSGTLTNATGLPISTGVSGLGTDVATFLSTPSSANLASAVTDETGSGALVFANSPTLVTPALGTPSSATLTNATGLPISTGVSGLGTGVATFLATPSSANLATAVSDETGTGALVFANSPTLVTPALGTPSSGTLTNATGLPLSTGVTGTLPVANGGTGTATPSLVAGTNVTITGTWPNQTIDATGGGGSGTVTSVAATVPSVFSISGSPITTSGTLAITYSGTALPVANGGTGQTSYTDGQLLIGNSTGNTLTKATLTAGTGISITNAAGAITIESNVSGGSFGTDLSYVDYLLTTSTAVGSSTIRMQSVSLDGTSELMIVHGTTSAHAVVFNTSTNTFGTPVLVRTASLGTVQNIALTAISSTSVLVCSLAANATALETVVLTISGSTITVNTPVATTLAAASNLIVANTRLVTVGSSYVLNYYNQTGTTPKFRAITVSGTTPSVGSELAYTAGGTLASQHHSYSHSSSILLSFSMTASTTVFAYPITVSGTTLTGGTAASVSTTDPSFMVTGALSNSRYALCYINTTGRGAVVSVAGSVASISTAATTMTVVGTAPAMQVFGNQAFVLTGGSSGDSINVLTDTAGTASLGTSLASPTAGSFIGYLNTSKVFFGSTTGGSSNYYQYGISSGSPVLEKTFQNITSTTVVTVQTFAGASYGRPLSGPPQSGSQQNIILRTSSGKIAIASNALLPFTISVDGTYPAKLQQTANPFTTFNDGIYESIVWGLPQTQADTATTIQLRKVTLS